jgi:O-antigen/teichoic acid export membrane protein
MAVRFVAQFRLLLVSASQVLVPTIAVMHESSEQAVTATYAKSYAIMFFLSLPFYSVLASSVPLVSELWIGRLEPNFVSFALLLIGGYWINTLAAPAYHTNLGTGHLRLNVASHVVITILNGTLGYALGSWLGEIGVVTAYSIALVLGSSVLILGFQLEHNIQFGFLVPKEVRTLLLLVTFSLIAAWFSFHLAAESAGYPGASLALFVATTLLVFCAAWSNELRKPLASSIFARLRKRIA